MSPVWTITYNGLEQSCAAWGLNARPIIRTRDRMPTSISFRMAGADPALGVPFPFKSQVIIKQNRTQTAGTWSGTGYVFTGYQTTPDGQVNGSSQGIMLEFQDVIWLLQNTTFQQLWKFPVIGNLNNTVAFSRVILFMNINDWAPGLYQSVQWELREIVNYAKTCTYDAAGEIYIPVQLGTIEFPLWFINYYHARAISCWDAILKCLEPVASAKAWVDGSTSPPTLHIRSRYSIATDTPPTATGPGPVTLQYKGTDSAGREHFNTKFKPRNDLIPSQVVLQYQQTNKVDGQSSTALATDVYPPGSTGQAAFALVAPIDLTGTNITTATLDCEPLACVGGDQASKRAWWSSKRGGEDSSLTDFRVRFQDTTGAAVTIGDATIVDDNGDPIVLASYPQRIVAGTYHKWMNNGGTPINAIRAHISVIVQYVEYDVPGSTPAETDTNGNVVKKSVSKQLHAHITLTNAPGGMTEFDNTTQYGEVAVTGLAQNIYTDRGTLDYDGTHEIIDRGILGETIPLAQIIGHWNVLNISGGDAAWASANMTIAGTEIDLITNHIRIDIGPAKHLQPQNWNTLLQFFRNRRIFLNSAIRANGATNGNTDMPKNTPDANTVPGLRIESAQVNLQYATENDPTSPPVGISNLDAKQIALILAGETPTPVVDAKGMITMQPREFVICDGTGAQYYAILDATAGHTKS
jgi:hypothetical protein